MRLADDDEYLITVQNIETDLENIENKLAGGKFNLGNL